MRKTYDYITITVTIICIIIVYCTVPGFDNPSTYYHVLKNAAFNGILAFGMLFVLICGDIDFSVEAQFALYGILFAMFLKVGVGVILAIAITAVISIVIGNIQGAFIVKFKLSAMICTLSIGMMINGISYVIAKGQPIYNMPSVVDKIGTFKIFNLATPSLVLFLMLIISLMILHRTYWGKFFYAIGSNAVAAEKAGVPVARTKRLAFALCSFCCAISAVVYVCNLGLAPLESSRELNTSVLTIAALGGVSFSGGRGKVLRVFCASLVMSALTSILVALGVPNYYQSCIKGAILFSAILTNFIKT